MMKCRNIKNDLPLYSDNLLSSERNGEIDGHLERCPLCREILAEYRAVRLGLSSLKRASIPAETMTSIREAVGAMATPAMFEFPRLRENWLRTRLGPALIGLVTSVIVGLGLLSFLQGTRVATQASAAPGKMSAGVMLATASRPLSSANALSASEYANSRLSVADQSPSLNPNGALVAFTDSFVRSHVKGDEMVVVANVFGNGLAEITDVIEPTHDSEAISELQQALDASLSDSPFVPASFDGRSDTVKVVLKFKSVNVDTHLNRRHR